MDSYKTAEYMKKLDNMNTKDEELKLIYEWTKTNHIDLKEFIYLMDYIEV